MSLPNTPRSNPEVARPTPRTLPTPSTSAATRTISGKKTTATPAPVRPFLFDASNYRLVIIGVVLILLGLFLMAGGKSADPHVFRYDEVFSFRRVTLAPVLMMIGFCLQIYAILKKPAVAREAIAVVMEDTRAADR